MPELKINLKTDATAKQYFEQIGLPNGPDGDDTAVTLEKWTAIRKMRQDGLLKPHQKALFVDDSPGHTGKLAAANAKEAPGAELAGAWLTIGRVDPVCNPENKPQNHPPPLTPCWRC